MVVKPESVDPVGVDGSAPIQSSERTLKEFIDEWVPRLAAIRDSWAATLPPEAADDWIPGAAYIRESSGRSLVGDAIDHQLRNALALCSQRRIYVAPDAVFFDVESGTDIGPRAAFQRLFERALAGGFKAIAVFINERLFRNLAQAIEIKRQFRLKGIELVYMGMYEGDRRNPAAWQLETMQDTAAELHARNTSFHVGMHLEGLTRAGRPVGRLPEVYREGPRAPSFLGRRGSIQSWEVIEPLASILQEGCRLYLAGMSHADLALWSVTTELRGVTPKERQMDKKWWYWVLTNPKYAGYQMPTKYMGYKPGKESPKRIRRTATSELVPCMLPALWTLDDYYAVLRVARKRWGGSKQRRTYRPYLLSGVAYDSDCRHRMKVEQNTTDGRYWMQCFTIGIAGREGHARRADVAGRELDELFAGLSFDDEDLLHQIEHELRELARAESVEHERFRANPAIAAVRQAISSLGVAGMDDVRADLGRRLNDLELLDVARREALSQPVVDFRRALDQLHNWSEVWADGDVATKNALLREAGVRAYLGRLPDDRNRRPVHVLSIEADNSVFELALATALRASSTTLGREQTESQPNAAIMLRSDDHLTGIAQRLLGARPGADHVEVRRYHFEDRKPNHNEPPVLAAGSWLTIDRYASEVGMSRGRVYERVRAGTLPAVRAQRGKRRWWLIHERELPCPLAEAA